MLGALLVSSQLMAQGISIGFRLGIPITPVLTADSPQQASMPRFAIGPLIEIPSWHGLGFGADFLLRRTGLAIPPEGSRQVNAWLLEAPVMSI
jgi:hypothetical protein